MPQASHLCRGSPPAVFSLWGESRARHCLGLTRSSGVDKSLYQGDIYYTDVLEESGRPSISWNTHGQSLTAFNTTVDFGNFSRVIFDTGTSINVGPHELVRQIYEPLGGFFIPEKYVGVNSSFWGFPCPTEPNTKASLKFAGVDWPIAFDDQIADIFAPIPGLLEDQPVCVGTFGSYNGGPGGL